MRYLYCGAGIFMIIGAIYSILKQSTTFHQGAFKRPVDKPRYIKFTSSVDIVCGVGFLVPGLLPLSRNVEVIICFTILIIAIVTSIYAGKKYRLE